MAVCRALGVARSHLHDPKGRAGSWRDGRKARVPAQDAQLLADIREKLSELPSYGYRRACALVNRKRLRVDAPRVNPKRVYRVMRSHGLSLPARSLGLTSP
jgi:putative transposase